MSGSLDAIRRTIAAFEQSDWTEIDVRIGDVRVHLVAGGEPQVADGRGDVMSQPDPPEPVPTAVPAPPRGALAGDGVQPAVRDDVYLVRAPSPGICWHSPQPGAPPFTDVGQRVEPGSTVCIVEVMKLMNHVKAGVSGEVVAVYGRNGEPVELGEALVAVLADDAPS